MSLAEVLSPNTKLKLQGRNVKIRGKTTTGTRSKPVAASLPDE
jgi:hypothetical protein